MRAVVLAYHDIGRVGIEALRRHGFEIAAVFTHADDPTESRWFGSVAELAGGLGLPVHAPEDINHPIWVERIRSLAPDILFSFYYRTLLGEPLLSIPPAGCLNLHGSLLPKYRGRAPINWALIRGEAETGVTLHYMTPRPDAGDIVHQRAFPILPDDTARSLFDRATAEAGALLDEALPLVRDGRAPRRPQPRQGASYFGRRTPEDGRIDWNGSSHDIRNLIRGVTAPYPGAFTHVGVRKVTIWSATELERATPERALPGTVLSASPLTVSCGEGVLRIDSGQAERGIWSSGERLAEELGLVRGTRFGSAGENVAESARRKSVLILGVNGFIGNGLGQRLLDSGRYDVYGLDLRSDQIARLIGRPGFHFTEGDISIMREWIEYHVSKCDIVIPLVAIATPIEYSRNPLRVFELDFEENLRVVRYSAKYRKRLIFPSTSEVYGMCEEPEFDEDESRLVLGPIRKQRWIYSCSKQLLDRVIWAYGETEGLEFTLFRPFNWIGPRLDSLSSARIGSSRAVTQLILNLVEGTPMQLIDGGKQKRCFTAISDGVECLFRIIENPDRSRGRIINIGNPENEASIRELAEILLEKFEQHPLRGAFPPFAGMQEIESRSYYGKGYQDVEHRRPSIRNAKKLLGWTPVIPLEQAISETLDYFLSIAMGLNEQVLEAAARRVAVNTESPVNRN